MSHRVETIALPAPAPGTGRALLVHRFGVPGARPKVYLHAAIHAGETPGLLVAEHLLGLLAAAEVIGEIVAVPVANPVGLAQRLQRQHPGRYDMASGENFNRGFPDLADAVDGRVADRLSDDETANIRLIRAAIADALEALPAVQESPVLKKTLLSLSHDADVVLDLHCARDAILHLFVNEDLWEETASLSAQLGCLAALLETETGAAVSFDEANAGVWRRLAHRHPERPIPIACHALTVELRGFAAVDDGVAAQDAANLFAWLQRRGAVAGDPGPLPEPLCDPTPLAAAGFVSAPATGVAAFRVAAGDHVRVGDVVAEIVELQTGVPGGCRHLAVAPTEGVVYEVAHRHYVLEGEDIAHIAGRTPLADQRDNLLGD